MRRVERAKEPKPAKLIAYDYETTRIQKGTPRPLYITAYSSGAHAAPEFSYEGAIKDMVHLQYILVTHFLTEEHKGCKFIAWNGNNFDAYFTAAALITHPDFVLRPFLTRSNALRGLKVLRREDVNNKKAKGWEFLDGIAMLGLVGTKLEKFLETFAPHLPKLTGTIDFEKETFDPKKPAHCDYAMRDSVGLEFAINRAQRIMIDHCDEPLAVTMGGICIKVLKANIPEDTVCYGPNDMLKEIVRGYALRGGFCYCVKRFEGPVWKYDLNQAYAAAMREARLPSDRAYHSSVIPKFSRAYIVRIQAWKSDNIVPFYCRTLKGDRVKSTFAIDHIPDTWVCTSEYEQLKKEGWRIQVFECWSWQDVFNLKDYVDKLERWRMTCEGGPSGPEGTIAKCVGNHSYGKTLEELEGITYILSNDCPEGYVPSFADGEVDPLEHVYEKFDEDVRPKDYHQPQIGAFITAHVRMVVRRAALIAPRDWLYADTDCVVFSSDVTASLDIDPKRYGAWKIEESGTIFQIIAKKVYTSVPHDGEKVKASAKGMHVRQVTPGQFTEWLAGKAPVQEQVQRNNFLKVMQGKEMYRSQTRSGTAVEGSL